MNKRWRIVRGKVLSKPRWRGEGRAFQSDGMRACGGATGAACCRFIHRRAWERVSSHFCLFNSAFFLYEAPVFIWVYRLLFAPLALLALPCYLLHMRRRGGYRERFGTRFGLGLRIPEKRPDRRRIWIQAVSLGEMLAIEPLVRGLASDACNEIFLTATTSTGYALAVEKYGAMALGIAYFPTDFWPFSKSVWDQVEPDLALCAETELWPEHLHQAYMRGTPFVLVNARLSDRSFGRAQALKWLTRSSLLKISRVYACSEDDARRFAAIGLPQERIEVTGNLKVDVAIEPVLNSGERRALRDELGLGAGFVLLGSSTWPGEEAMLIDALKRLRQEDGEAKLLIVPRHGERREEIEALLKQTAGPLRWHLKSRGLPQQAVDILVADTHGELRKLTQVADLAFVGKTLPPHKEGQTPVECGALGVPMVFGTGMSNFRSIRAGLRQFGAVREVEDREMAIKAICSLRNDEDARRKMSEGGQTWHRSSRGAVEKTLAGLERWL